MPKLQLTTTAAVVTEVKLAPQARKMLLERFEEHEKLAKVVKAAQGTKKKPGRMRRIADEVQELFRAEKQGKALLAGTALNEHRVKLVMGTRKVFDQMGFMKKHGLTQEDFDEFTEEVDSEPYVKISHGKDDDE
mgnify:CR=1 FL=1